MNEDNLSSSLICLPDDELRPRRTGLRWRTRIIPGSRARHGLTLAIQVDGRGTGTAREDRGAIRSQALRLVVQLTDAAVRDGFRAELRPADRSRDMRDGNWFCAALLHLSWQWAGPEPG